MEMLGITTSFLEVSGCCHPQLSVISCLNCSVNNASVPKLAAASDFDSSFVCPVAAFKAASQDAVSHKMLHGSHAEVKGFPGELQREGCD